MESSKYNNLAFKVQTLENKLRQVTDRSRNSYDSNATFLTKHPCNYESIINLLELAKYIKHDLRCSLDYSPENRKTLKMCNKVGILESELYNLLNYAKPLQNTNRKRSICGAKDSCRFTFEAPLKDSLGYSDDFPTRSCRQQPLFEPREKKKICSNRCFENGTEPEYILVSETSSDSFDVSSYNYLSSGSSSSIETVETIRKPFYVVKSKSSYQSRPSTTRIGRKIPERIPISVRSSRGSSRRKRDKRKKHKPVLKKSYLQFGTQQSDSNSRKKRDKRKRHKPTLKKSSLQFGIYKSDSNKINVNAHNLQTQETEVFLVKKKRKPSRSRERSSRSPGSGRFFISRLKRVMSTKSKPLVSKRNKSPKAKKSSTPKYKNDKNVKNLDKKKLGISKYKESNHGLENSSSKYSVDSLHDGGKRRNNPFKKRTQSQMSVESGSNSDSKTVAVARSGSLNSNPFYAENRIFYLQGNDFVLLPKKLSSKDLYFLRNNGNSVPYLKGIKETLNKNFIKPEKISNHRKNSNISNTDSNYEILGSHQSSNVYLKENVIPSHTSQLDHLKSSSKDKPNSKTHERSLNSFAGGQTNQCDSLDSNKKSDYCVSNIKSKRKNNSGKSDGKLILLRVVNDQFSLFKDKESSILSIKNVNNKGRNISLSERLNYKKENSFHNNPFGANAMSTAPIYLATVPQTFAQLSAQNQPDSKKTQHKVGSYSYIVNAAVGNVQNKESLSSANISNIKNVAAPMLQSSPSVRSVLNSNQKKIDTLNKSASQIFPTPSKAKDMKNSHDGTKGVSSQNIDKAQPTIRNQSHSDDSKSVGSNQSSTNKKTKKWLPRSLSKLSIISKKSKKAKSEKTNKSLHKEDSTNNLPDISKHVSNEKQLSSETVPKAKSWTNFKRTMSGIGSRKKLGKKKSTEKQTAIKKVEKEKKLKKNPSLLKRMFSREKQSKSKTQLVDDAEQEISSTGPQSITEFEGDKTSFSSNHSRITADTVEEGKNLDGYQVASKIKKKGFDGKKDKQKPILTSLSPSNKANNKKQNLKDNPEAFNYSLHYSKQNHKCFEMDLVPSTLCLADCCCPQTVVKTCGSKNLWSKGETVLSEHELSEFEKHNKYCEYFFKPNRCRGCTVYDKKVSKVCQKRRDRNLFKNEPYSAVCNHDNDHLYTNDPNNYFTKKPSVNTSDPILSDSSDICDWKKIANEIKECHEKYLLMVFCQT